MRFTRRKWGVMQYFTRVLSEHFGGGGQPVILKKQSVNSYASLHFFSSSLRMVWQLERSFLYAFCQQEASRVLLLTMDCACFIREERGRPSSLRLRPLRSRPEPCLWGFSKDSSFWSVLSVLGFRHSQQEAEGNEEETRRRRRRRRYLTVEDEGGMESA